MVWIRVETQKHAIVDSTPERAFNLLRNVERMANLMPGVQHTETLGADRYRCVLHPQRALGFDFVGDYVCSYRDNGRDQITWDSPDGNMRSQGSWLVAGDPGAVVLRLSITTEINLPVPALLRVPARAFAARRASRGVDVQLELIRERLEAVIREHPTPNSAPEASPATS